MSSEIRIRVKPNVKEMLEANKEKYGFSINFQVNFAIFKYLILDSRTPYWKLDTRPNPHYETINKLPEDVKYCDSDRCEIDYLKTTEKPNPKPLIYANQDKDDLRGDKC